MNIIETKKKEKKRMNYSTKKRKELQNSIKKMKIKNKKFLLFVIISLLLLWSLFNVYYNIY